MQQQKQQLSFTLQEMEDKNDSLKGEVAEGARLNEEVVKKAQRIKDDQDDIARRRTRHQEAILTHCQEIKMKLEKDVDNRQKELQYTKDIDMKTVHQKDEKQRLHERIITACQAEKERDDHMHDNWKS